ncbi:hypothetical protein KIN20_026132 [Parelaphostrongylus tenuis]|uniref:Uncharacterized protein n=1 Tax=Parelaphostrongylus tenuis TaxID=148309 RepID=A0AAD5MWC9_PARTN|nr:hypothetical protein KIN20_026132 [Parelaphostrongylus tenuis]
MMSLIQDSFHLENVYTLQWLDSEYRIADLIGLALCLSTIDAQLLLICHMELLLVRVWHSEALDVGFKPLYSSNDTTVPDQYEENYDNKVNKRD